MTGGVEVTRLDDSSVRLMIADLEWSSNAPVEVAADRWVDVEIEDLMIEKNSDWRFDEWEIEDMKQRWMLWIQDWLETFSKHFEILI